MTCDVVCAFIFSLRCKMIKMMSIHEGGSRPCNLSILAWPRRQQVCGLILGAGPLHILVLSEFPCLPPIHGFWPETLESPVTGQSSIQSLGGPEDSCLPGCWGFLSLVSRMLRGGIQSWITRAPTAPGQWRQQDWGGCVRGQSAKRVSSSLWNLRF